MIKRLLFLSLFTSAGVSATCDPNLGNDWSNARYSVVTANSETTVTDAVTGLMWKLCPEGTSALSNCHAGSFLLARSWIQALEIAENANYAGHEDWRLPNINELSSLVAYNCAEPTINNEVFPGDGYSNSFSQNIYWSSTPTINGNNVKAISFEEGEEFERARDAVHSIRLVRSN